MDDKQIINLYFSRSEYAITETASKYGRLCYKIACNVLSDRHDLEECVNDTYLCLWNTIPPQRPNNLMAFIAKIVRNLSLKKLEYNRAKKRSSHFTVSLSELETTLPDRSLQSPIEEQALGKMINEFLRGEKEEIRNVFIRRYYFYDDVKDIAKRYEFSETKVKSMLFHTRNKLKKFLIKKGVCL